MHGIDSFDNRHLNQSLSEYESFTSDLDGPMSRVGTVENRFVLDGDDDLEKRSGGPRGPPRAPAEARRGRTAAAGTGRPASGAVAACAGPPLAAAGNGLAYRAPTLKHVRHNGKTLTCKIHSCGGCGRFWGFQKGRGCRTGMPCGSPNSPTCRSARNEHDSDNAHPARCYGHVLSPLL